MVPGHFQPASRAAVAWKLLSAGLLSSCCLAASSSGGGGAGVADWLGRVELKLPNQTLGSGPLLSVTVFDVACSGFRLGAITATPADGGSLPVLTLGLAGAGADCTGGWESAVVGTGDSAAAAAAGGRFSLTVAGGLNGSVKVVRRASGGGSQCRCCRSAAPPSPLRRRFDNKGERVPVDLQWRA